MGAMLLKFGSEGRVDDGEKDDAWLPFDLGKNPVELARCADKGVNVLQWLVIGIVSSGGSSDSIKGFAGRIGDKVHVKVVTGRLVHREPWRND